MLHIITSSQMKMADEYTIKYLSISSCELMERASFAFVSAFIKDNPDKTARIAVFCGQGNNGGDGLAIARMLNKYKYIYITVYKVNFSAKQSQENFINQQKLQEKEVEIIEISHSGELQKIHADIIIDAIVGSGLNKSLSGEFLKLINIINDLNQKVYAVDVPSGMFGEGEFPEVYNGIKAYKTISFQRPKLSFFFPESMAASNLYEVVDIGLQEEYIQSLPTDFLLIEQKDIQKINKPRERFSHKGNYGHALIIGGSKHTMGAAILNCMGAVFSGVGLVSACIPESGLTALNTSIPEAMYVSRDNMATMNNLEKYNAIAVGSGLNTDEVAVQIVAYMIATAQPLILDADALNILSDKKELLNLLPEHTILTPHMKEFDRLFGEHKSWWQRVETARQQALKRKIIIVLKNHYTFICSYDGKVYINPTGNPAMAQGGMGDVLTGIIASLSAQGYNCLESCILACYIHGKAGDTLSENKIVVTASELARQIAAELKKETST